MANNPNLRVMQVPPTTTISAHVEASNPHPQYLLTTNLLNEAKVQISLDDLNNVDMEDAPAAKSVLVHYGDSWTPVEIGDLVSDIHFVHATTSSYGVTKLAVYNDIIECASTTVITPDLLSKYVSNCDKDLKDYLDEALANNQVNIGYATTTSAGVVRLAVPADVSVTNNSNVVTGNLLYQQLAKKQDKLIAGDYIDVNALTSSVVKVTGVQAKLTGGVGINDAILQGYSVVEVKDIPQNRVVSLVEDLAAKQPMLEKNGLYTSIVTTTDNTYDPPVVKHRVDVVGALADVPDLLDGLTNEFHEHEHSTEAHAELMADLLENVAREGEFVVTDDAAGYVLLPINERYNLVAQWGYITGDRFVTKTSNAFNVDYKVQEDFTYPLHYVINVAFSPDMLTQSVVLNKNYIFTSNNAGDTVYNRFLDNEAADPYSDEELLTNNIETFVCTASKAGATAGGTSWLSIGVAVNTDIEPNTLFVAWMPPHIEYSKDLLGYAKRKTYPIGIDDYQIIPIIAVEANRTDRWYGHDYLQTITDVVDGSFACNANILEAKDTFKNALDCFNSTWALLGKMKSLKDYTNGEIGINGLGLDSDYYYNFLPITLNLNHCFIEKIDKNTLCIKIKISATQTFVIQSGVIAGGTANKDIHWLNLPTPLDDLLHADFSVRAYTNSATLVNQTERNVYINYAARCNHNGLYPEYRDKICALSITSLGFKNIGNSTSDNSVYYNKKHQIQWIVYGIVNEENTDYVEDAIYDPTNKYLSLPVSNNYRFKFNWGSLVHRLGKITPSPNSEAGYVATTPYSSLDEYNGAVMTINSSVANENAPVVGQTQQLYRYFIRFYNKMYWCNNASIPFDRVIKCGVTQFQWKETYNSTIEQYDDFFVTGDYDGSDFTFDAEFSSNTKDPNRLKHQMRYNTYNGTKQDVGTAQYRQDVEKNNYQYQLFLDRTYWGSYVVATETAPRSGVTYYTKNNKGVYSEFTGTTFASDTTYYVKADKNIPAYSELCVVHNAGGSGTNGDGCVTNLSWMMIIATDRLYETLDLIASTKSSVLTWTVHSFGYNDPDYNGRNPSPWQSVDSSNTSVSRYTTTVTNNNGTSVSTLTENTAANDITVDTISDNNNLNRVISDSNQRCDYAYNLPGKVISMYVDSTDCELGTTGNGTHIDEPYSSSKVYWYIRRDTEKEDLDPNGYYTLNGVYLHMLGIRGTSVSNAIMIYFDNNTKIKIQDDIITIESLHVKFNNGGNDAGNYDINFTSSNAPIDPETEGFSLLSIHTNTGGEDTSIVVTIKLTSGGDILIDARCNVHVIINRVCYSEIMTTYCDDTSSTEEFIRIPTVYNYKKDVEKEFSK